MKPVDEKNAAEIFDQASQIETTEARHAFVQGACRNDEDLYHRVQELLAAYAIATEAKFLNNGQNVDDLPTLGDIKPLEEESGSQIGRYKLLQKIGEGGMGVVYMAEQAEPVKRKVALKIIKLGMDTKSVVARFEAERQALAMMDHPNIARVLDGGATESGRPYFVMELVKGVPITEFCDKNKLPVKGRLELFIQVCKAIQSAHQKGVIHRDIKPSNILVTLHHGDPMPKVIDFGIAKATNQKLTEKTLFTNYAQMIGTPAYMSPEQAEMSSMDVDTRTDIYSLGVLLYELLTGAPPFPEKELLSQGYGEMQRIIAEKEPELPSSRLSTIRGEQQAVVTQNRRADSNALSRQLSGDLDWITLKALEKDRTRRYDTANGLAEDVRRHLENEPVSAARPSLGYRLMKLYRREKATIHAVAAMMAVLAAGSVYTFSLYLDAKSADREKTRFLFDSRINEAEAWIAAGKKGYHTNVLARIRETTSKTLTSNQKAKLRNIALKTFSDATIHEITETDRPVYEADRVVKFYHVGPTIYFGYDDGTIRIYDGRTGAQQDTLTGGHQARICAFARFPDPDTLLSADSDGTVVYWRKSAEGGWDVANSYSNFELPGPPCLVASATSAYIFNPVSQYLFQWTPEEDEAVRLENPLGPDPNPLRDDSKISDERLYEVSGRILTVSRDGSFWVMMDEPGYRIYDTVQRIFVKDIDYVIESYFSPAPYFFDADNYLAFAHSGGAEIYSTRNWSLVGKCDAFAFHPFYIDDADEGEFLIYGGVSQTVVWDRKSQRILEREIDIRGKLTAHPLENTLTSFRIHGGENGMSVANLTTYRSQNWLRNPAEILNPGHNINRGLAVSPNGRWIAESGPGGANIYDRQISRSIQLEGELAKRNPEDASFSRDSRYVAFPDSYKSKDVLIVDTTNWKLAHRIPCEQAISTRFHPTQDFLAVGDASQIAIYEYSNSQQPGNPVVFNLVASQPTTGGVPIIHIDGPRDVITWTELLESPSISHDIGSARWNIADFPNLSNHVVREPDAIDTYGAYNTLDIDPTTGDVYALKAPPNQTAETENSRGARIVALKSPNRAPETVLEALARVIKISPDGHLLFVNEEFTHRNLLYDMKTRELIAEIPHRDFARVMTCEWTGDSTELVIQYLNGDVIVWNIAKARSEFAEFGLDW